MGETVTLTFTARASVDGRYCDTASFDSAAAGTGADEGPVWWSPLRHSPLSSAMPPLVASSLASTYRSTITVTNVGTVAVSEVILSDRLGLLQNGTNFVEHESSSLEGTAGTFDPRTNRVTFASVPLAPDASVTATVTSSIPSRARPGEYCDIARYTSANAGSDTAEACVTVTAFSAIQASLADEEDPCAGPRRLMARFSTRPAPTSAWTTITSSSLFGNGQFTIQGTRLFFDSDPIVDPVYWSGRFWSSGCGPRVGRGHGLYENGWRSGRGDDCAHGAAPARPGDLYRSYGENAAGHG